ncbi:MAG: EamA family transporter [Chloroflexota bacterium]
MQLSLGFLFAILTSAFMGLAQVFIRRSTYRSAESFTPMAVSLLVGTPLFVFIVLAAGQWDALFAFTWAQYALLVGAGLIHFIVGRYLFFNGTRLIGANPTVAISQASIIFSVIIGVTVLRETITALEVAGALLIMAGAVMSSLDIGRRKFRISARGLLLGLGTALCVAGSGSLIRPVMEVSDAVYAATFISYLSAFIIVVVLLLLGREQREHVLRQGRRNFLVLLPAAVLLLVGHLFRFSAFKYSPVSIAQPLMGTIVIFTLVFSLAINRRIDVFNWRVLAGIVMVLAGVFLLYS